MEVSIDKNGIYNINGKNYELIGSNKICIGCYFAENEISDCPETYCVKMGVIGYKHTKFKEYNKEVK